MVGSCSSLISKLCKLRNKTCWNLDHHFFLSSKPLKIGVSSSLLKPQPQANRRLHISTISKKLPQSSLKFWWTRSLWNEQSFCFFGCNLKLLGVKKSSPSIICGPSNQSNCTRLPIMERSQMIEVEVTIMGVVLLSHPCRISGERFRDISFHDVTNSHDAFFSVRAKKISLVRLRWLHWVAMF